MLTCLRSWAVRGPRGYVGSPHPGPLYGRRQGGSTNVPVIAGGLRRGICHPFYVVLARGSTTSRIPSPTKFMARTARAMATPGDSHSQGMPDRTAGE